MPSLTLFFKSGETFILGGQLATLSKFYEDVIDGEKVFIELADSSGARLSVRRDEVSGMMLDPVVESNAILFSSIVELQAHISSSELNQIALKDHATAQIPKTGHNRKKPS